MVRAIRNEADAEWYAWQKELVRRKNLEKAEKEYKEWKESQKRQVYARIVPADEKQSGHELVREVCQRFAF
jgi:flavorubredoxin